MKKTNLSILLTSCLEVQAILLDSMDFNLGKEVKFVKQDWSLIHACWDRSIMRSVCKTYIRSYRIIEILDGFKTSSKLFFEAHITLLNYIIRLHLLMPLENIKRRIVYLVSKTSNIGLFTWWASLTGIWNVLLEYILNSWGFPGYFSCEPDARYRVPLPFRTTKTSSQECLWIGVCDPGANVWSHTSTCKNPKLALDNTGKQMRDIFTLAFTEIIAKVNSSQCKKCTEMIFCL